MIRPTRFAWLLVGAAVLTIVLKTAAYLVTDSVGLLSDALESVINLAAAFLALVMLAIAARPPDELHAYGHGKAEYFSSAVEGALIVLSAVGIAWTSIPRLIMPRPIEMPAVGIMVAIVASAINLVVARVLLRAGRESRSAALEASGQHLIADAWTSAAVITGVAVVALTGWSRLDPILALVVAGNIVRTGTLLVRGAAFGLMDTAISAGDRDIIAKVLESYASRGVQYHALRTREAGARKFVSVHVLVPGEWTVQHGHELLEELEADIRRAVPGAHIFTHLEPSEDPAAWRDIALDGEEG